MTSTATRGRGFDPLDPELGRADGPHRERFWPVLLALQRSSPVFRSDARGGFWAVTGFDNVNQAARDWETFTSAEGAEAVPLEAGETGFRLIPAEVDPPRHRELRKLLNPAFRIGAVHRYAAEFQRMADSLVDEFADRGACDFVAEFAMPFPGEVFFRCFLGLDPERSLAVRRMVDSMLMDPANAAEAFTEFVPWCSEVVDERRQAGPQGDVLDAIVDGVDSGLLDSTDQFSALLTIIGAGIETTAMGIGNIAMHLAADPALRERLRGADLSQACSEFLRFEAPVPAMGRVATRDVELGGQLIKKGDRVVLYFGAANRDSRAWTDTDRIDIHRPDAERHLAFGTGPHRCLGLHVAQLELVTATRTILERIPDLRLDPTNPITWRTALTRGPAGLPVLFTPSGGERTG
ncbi:MAG TPA: cytochrome P450 [Pseudonocardia sp.]|jgi:cytochrome P450